MGSTINTSHLSRSAIVYVRQSTATQVLENRESTKRQYALVDRARSLGWDPDAIEIIDDDLGCSGASVEGRKGFARLAEAVARGQAGAVLSLEVSRLARSSQDWQRLLRLCAVAGVVVVDEQSVYDPANGDDRMLLDLKGTMSEAELRWLRLRLAGGKLSKARRGELRFRAPTGYVWGPTGMDFHPDASVQEAIRLVFERFSIEPSAGAVVRWANCVGFAFPTHECWGAGAGEVTWKPLTLRRLCDVLRNPAYAGVYAYGRRPTREVLDGERIRKVRPRVLDPDAWSVKIEQAHPAYTTWEQFLMNHDKLGRNSPGPLTNKGAAPREGPSLLPGLVICGRCGRRMRVRYWGRQPPQWSYVCPAREEPGKAACFSVSGRSIDGAVEAEFLAAFVPDHVELCLAVEHEASQQTGGLERQWKLRIERARYDARLAERRYKAVDPDNRVVARTLENDWELRLRQLEEVNRGYQRARQERHVELTGKDRDRIRTLAQNLPAVWRAKTTTPADRKAMLQLVIEAVALTPIDVPDRETLIRVQWRSRAVTELRLARPRGGARTQIPAAVPNLVRELSTSGAWDKEIASHLNQAGFRTSQGRLWNGLSVFGLRKAHGINKRRTSRPTKTPLPERHPDGRYSLVGAARALGINPRTVRRWLNNGKLSADREDYGTHRNAIWIRLNDPAKPRYRAPQDVGAAATPEDVAKPMSALDSHGDQ
jgi:DNA invertase Pin-like site-specific DNA recombinase